MSTPQFSLIMPAYKKRFLAQTVKSILAQTYTDFELVVVNDASPEHLQEVMSEFHDDRLRYEENVENIGGRDLVANWNHCLQYATGTYVILATDDDYFEPTYLEDAACLIQKYPAADLLRQGVKKIDGNGEPLEYELFPKEFLTAEEFAYFLGCCGLISCISNFIFKREPLLSKGGFVSFPHAHYSDVATALVMSLNGVACIQQWNLGFRMSDENLSNRSDKALIFDQAAATEHFIVWAEHHIKGLDDNIFARKAFWGFRNQYLRMMETLLCKLPYTAFFRAIGIIGRCHYAYMKEKVKLLGAYLIK